jgi:hypothetical protein
MKILTFLSILFVLAFPVDSSAQAGGGAAQSGTGGHEPAEDIRTRNALSQADLKRLAEQLDQWRRVEGTGGVPPRVAKSRTAAMLRVLNVSCAVADAAYRGVAPDHADQHIYEAACNDGLGYLFFLQQETLTGTSCLATDRDDSQVKCALPANSDSKIMAGTVLKNNHVQCNVKDVKWLGASAANLDHVEVACESSGGYVVRSPQPGSSGKLDVLSCPDAIKQGIVCELSVHAPSATASSADLRPTLSWFKEALSRNGVSCQSKRARIVGRESIKRRYLVEFECSDRPEGLIAFVPPAGDTANAFESMNCAVAAERGIRCELLTNGNSQPTR